MPEKSKDGKTPFLSIIIPAFNEALRLPATLDRICAFVKDRGSDTEVVVVDNASTDATKGIVVEFSSRYTFVRYLFGSTGGKGAAVKTGILAARGDYLLICDADLAVPIEEVDKFLPPRLSGFDVVIGSREMEGARRYGEPFHRHFMGRVFNVLVRILVLPGIQDTQCGFKCFRREAARELFSISRIDGWSFDVEVLRIARLKNYRIAEVPVNWYYGESSKISPLRDTCGMFREVLDIRRNERKGRYG